MIPVNIAREHIIKAIEEARKEVVPAGRDSQKYHLEYDGKSYPPKYIVWLANKYANGNELEPSEFGGGYETNGFLESLGFKISSDANEKRNMDIRIRNDHLDSFFKLEAPVTNDVVGSQSRERRGTRTICP